MDLRTGLSAVSRNRVYGLKAVVSWAGLLLCLGCDVAQVPEGLDAVLVLWSLGQAPEIELGELDGAEEVTFSGVQTGVLLPDGRFAVVDRLAREIRAFDSDGSLAWIAGGRGEGPGEFQSIFWLRILGQELIAYDGRGFRTSFFSVNGEHRRTERMDLTGNPFPSRVLSTLGNGRFFVTVSKETENPRLRPGFQIRSYEDFYAIMAEGGVDTLGLFPHSEQFWVLEGDNAHFGDPPFGKKPLLAPADSSLVFGVGNEPHLIVFGWDGSVDTVSVAVPERAMTDEWYARAEEAYLEGLEEEDLRIHRLAFRRSPRPGLVPPFDEVHVDPENRIWVRRYDLPRETRTWFVQSRAGEGIASIEIPEFLSVLDIGTERILTRTTDSLGVDRVQVWQIQR